MKSHFFSLLAVVAAFCGFIMLMLFPEASTGGAKAGLSICAGIILPALFPFMVFGNLLNELGAPTRLGKIFSPITKRLFGVSGAGTAAIFLGLLGGYPLGAISASDMYRRKVISKREAERLLGFCNNTGPAFIVSVAGSAIFNSVRVGLFLYGVHIVAAIITGLLLRGSYENLEEVSSPQFESDFSAAFTQSVKSSAVTCVTVCGFVVFFSVLVGLLDSLGVLPALSGEISRMLGLELHFTRSFLTGLLELGTGISSMAGLRVCATNLSLCAFILGWGGISVHAQALAAIKESGLKAATHLLGKLLHGLLSALLCLVLYPVFF